MNAIITEISKLPPKQQEQVELFELDRRDYTSFDVKRDDEGRFVVSGGLIDKMSRGIILSDPESFAYFQRRLKQNGIIDKLLEKGLVEGDTVKIGPYEFTYVE